MIFLDLDGVVADFDRHATEQDKRHSDGSINRDLMDFQWWSTIPVFEGAHDFFEALKALAPVKFLTGPMLNPASHGGKAEWLSKKFLTKQEKWALRDLIICPSKDKHLLAQENRILIDDRINNIKDWEAAGGIAIHHTGDFNETLSKVDRVLKKNNQPIKSVPKSNLAP